MPSPPDRFPHIVEQFDPADPLPPLNFSVQSGLETGVIDLRWSSPGELPANSKFTLLGVNIYRSFDSEFGPWFRMNSLPIGATFWRDKTRVQVKYDEDVSESFLARGSSDPDSRYIFRTAQRPIVIDEYRSVDCTNINVQVTINGIQASVLKITSELGEVELDGAPSFNVASQTKIPAVIPILSSDVVLASYRYLGNEVPTNLGQRIFYRITTVGKSIVDGELFETPLDRASSANNQQTEQIDWIWKEAVRRNKFLLYQAGERVKVFIRKNVGPKCGCGSSLHGQADATCLVCFGTSIIGGFEGPYDMLIAPDDAEKAKSQSNRGRSLTHSYDTWTGPSPILSQRDFIVKLNGDRYSIGPVRSPTSRGMILQQHFSVSHLDEPDIRYKVPVMNTSVLVSPQTRYLVPGQGKATPMVTERQAIVDEREFRGSTPTYENTYRR